MLITKDEKNNVSHVHHKTAPEDRVSVGGKVAFGVGAMSDGLMQSTPNVLHTILNINVGVSPIYIGYIGAVSRAWDAIIDPFMGWLSDNTNTRFGRRKPFMVIGCLLAPLIFILMCYFPAGKSEMFYFWYVVLLSLIYFSCTTVYSIPYNAMSYELSADYHERTRIMAYRTAMAAVLGVFSQWIYWLTQRSCFKDPLEGLRFVSLLVAVFIVITGIVPILFAKPSANAVDAEVVRKAAPKDKIGLKEMRQVLNVWPFYYVIGTLVSCMLGLFLVGTLGLYVLIYHVCGGDAKEGSYWLGVGGSLYQFLSIVSAPMIAWVSTRLGKRRTLSVFLAFAMLGSLLKWFIYTPTFPWLSITLSFFFAPGLSAMWTLLSSMMADVCDWDELENNHRREAIFAAIYQWAMKVGFTLCSLFSGYILVATGFDAKLGPQSPETIFIMRILFCLVPATGLLIGIFLINKFPITEAKAYEIRAALKARKEGK